LVKRLMGIVVYRVGAVVGDVSARDLFCAAGRRVLAAEAWLWTFSPSIPFYLR
jgi:hypothetical protein